MNRVEKAALIVCLTILALLVGIVMAYAVPQILQPHP